MAITHPHLYAYLASLDRKLSSRDELLCSFRFTIKDSHALRETAQVARGKAQPAAGGPIFPRQAVQGDGVELGKPEGRCGGHAPGEQSLVIRQRRTRYMPCALADEGGMLREFIGRPQQIRQHAAFQHFALDGFRRGSYANRNRLALANLVFEDAQGFAERSHQKVGDSVPDCLLLRCLVGGCGQRRGACDICRHQQSAASRIEFARVKKFAAEGRF